MDSIYHFAADWAVPSVVGVLSALANDGYFGRPRQELEAVAPAAIVEQVNHYIPLLIRETPPQPVDIVASSPAPPLECAGPENCRTALRITVVVFLAVLFTILGFLCSCYFRGLRGYREDARETRPKDGSSAVSGSDGPESSVPPETGDGDGSSRSPRIGLEQPPAPTRSGRGIPPPAGRENGDRNTSSKPNSSQQSRESTSETGTEPERDIESSPQGSGSGDRRSSSTGDNHSEILEQVRSANRKSLEDQRRENERFSKEIRAMLEQQSHSPAPTTAPQPCHSPPHGQESCDKVLGGIEELQERVVHQPDPESHKTILKRMEAMRDELAGVKDCREILQGLKEGRKHTAQSNDQDVCKEILSSITSLQKKVTEQNVSNEVFQDIKQIKENITFQRGQATGDEILNAVNNTSKRLPTQKDFDDVHTAIKEIKEHLIHRDVKKMLDNMLQITPELQGRPVYDGEQFSEDILKAIGELKRIPERPAYHDGEKACKEILKAIEGPHRADDSSRRTYSESQHLK